MNYQQAKIYCIKVNTEEEYLPYVGSSCKRLLSQRMNQHRCSYKNWKKGKQHFVSSFTLFEKFGIENCYIELIELFPCKCNDELRKKEREWFDKIKCCNKLRPFITEEERVERVKIYGNIYNKLNKEIIFEKKKIYQQEHKEEIAKTKKIHYNDHKEEILQKIKEYHDEHKEELSEKRKEKYDCLCGSTLRIADKSHHEKTKKHQNYFKSSPE